MSLTQRIREMLRSPQSSAEDAKYEHAVELLEEVSQRVREHARVSAPFRSLVLDFLFRSPQDPTLIAEAYEIGQEARIFRGQKR